MNGLYMVWNKRVALTFNIAWRFIIFTTFIFGSIVDCEDTLIANHTVSFESESHKDRAKISLTNRTNIILPKHVNHRLHICTIFTSTEVLEECVLHHSICDIAP